MPLNPDAVGTVSEPSEATWTSKDSLLYALGVGAGATDPTGFELEFTTENSNGIEQKALPTMPVVLGGTGGAGPMSAIGTFDWAMLVHGEQAITLHKPVPVAGTAMVTGQGRRDVRQGQGRGGRARERGPRARRRPAVDHHHVGLHPG